METKWINLAARVFLLCSLFIGTFPITAFADFHEQLSAPEADIPKTFELSDFEIYHQIIENCRIQTEIGDYCDRIEQAFFSLVDQKLTFETEMMDYTTSVLRTQKLITLGMIALGVFLCLFGFWASLKQFLTKPTDTGGEIELELSKDKIRVASNLVGLLIFSAVLVFIYFCLSLIYPISSIG